MNLAKLKCLQKIICGMWRHVAWYNFTSLSEEHAVSFFRVEILAKQATYKKGASSRATLRFD